MGNEHRAKEKSLKTKRLFASLSYYKLKAREHFVHYVFGLGSKGYGVGGVEEVLDQVLMVLRVFSGLETMGRSRSSWPERACATANATAAP